MNRRAFVITVSIVVIVLIFGLLIFKDSGIEFDFTPKVNEDLSFSSIGTVEKLKQYENKEITLFGFMSPLSPYGYSYVYLGNMPYTVELFGEEEFNSIAVLNKDQKVVMFTNDIVCVTGKLVFGDFIDDNNTSYKYRIENATIVEATEEQISKEMIPYYILSKEEILSDLNEAFGIADFMLYYNEYLEKGWITEENLTAVDTEKLDKMLTTIAKYENYDFSVMNKCITDFKDIAIKLNAHLEKKQYDKFKDYSETFNTMYYSFEDWIKMFVF